MSDLNNLQPQTNEAENKNRTKDFWINVGIVALSLVLSVITVLVLNLNG